MDDFGTFLFWLCAAAGIFLYVLWDQAIVLQFRFDTKMDNITIDHKPKDCDFLTAPLGLKNCHYEALINKQGEWLYVGWKRINS